ncbi:MAG: putative zinc-finger [Acidimicrobiaceae bacterium]|jgi:anti-sigma factor RsiW|nr:putative zinc-finger [Acidimicrobiaceae bacterium]
MRQPEVRCVEFVEQVTQWLEGGLTDEERLLFEEHLAYCSPCSRFMVQFRQSLALSRMADGYMRQGPPPMVRAALQDAFRQSRR